MNEKEQLAALVKEVTDTGKLVAATAAHVEDLRTSSESVWKKLDAFDLKLDATAKSWLSKIESSLACARADRKLCDLRFTAIELRQGVTTTRLATVIAGAFFALQLVVWLAQWGFAELAGRGTVP